MAGPGTFITFEGIDGSGKTTQLRILAGRLQIQGYLVVDTAEPGGTPLGLEIRRMLLDPANVTLDTRAELLLYFASRAQNIKQIILPGLNTNAIVLCDRFTDSTLAYQGSGRGVARSLIFDLDRLACGGLQPNLTLLIDIDPATSRGRAQARNRDLGSHETRIDDESLAFHTRVRQGYLDLAREQPERIRIIDGTRDQDTVARLVWEEVAPFVR